VLRFCATWIEMRSGKVLRAIGRALLFVGRRIEQLTRIIVRVAKFMGIVTQKIYNVIKPYVTKLVSTIGTVLRHMWNATKKVVQFVDHYVTLVLTKVVLAVVDVIKFTGRIVKKVALFVDKVVTWILTKTVQMLFKTTKFVLSIAKKVITMAWKVSVKIATFLKDLLVEMMNTLVVLALKIRVAFLKTARVVGKILTFCGRLLQKWIWRPLVAVAKFIDRVVTAVLEWTLQTAWKGLKILAEKFFSLLTTISRYVLKALKLLVKATKFVAVHAARVFVKVVSFIQMVLFKLGDKLFDFTLDLIAYTARLLRFIAFHIIKPTTMWLWIAIKVVAKFVWRLATSLVELVKSVVLTIYHVTSSIGGHVGRAVGFLLLGLARLLVKFHGLVVTTVGIVAKFLLELIFRVLYCVDFVVTKVASLVSYPVKWLLTLAALLTDYGLRGFWHLLVIAGKLANYLILVPVEKTLWAAGELLTLTLNILREVMLVGGTLLTNAVEWLHDNFLSTVKLAVLFAWASITWLASTGVTMAQRFVVLVKISATFLLKVKRKIGAFLIAMKNAVVRMKNRLVALYNRSGIPRLLAAIKTASIILATGSKQRFIAIKNSVGAIITQMRENGKKRRARMWAFAKARMQQIKERTAKIAAVIAVISGQITQRARASVARLSVAMAFMKQRGIAMKNRAIVLKNHTQAKIALVTLRMQQRFVQVNQFIVYMQARMAALLKQRVGNRQNPVNPPNNNAVVQNAQ
jgi:hypothetical protein